MKYSTAISGGIYCIDANYIRSRLASIYLLREKDEVAIIETGTQNTLPGVLSALAELNIHPDQVKYVIPTHIHLDHAGGAGGLMEICGRAKLIIHPRGARHMINPEKLIKGVIAVYGEDEFNRLYGNVNPVDENRIEIANDLDVFYLNQRELVFVDTPGHARHHFCVYDARTNGFFTGDTFGIAYPPLQSHPYGLIPTSSPVQFDPGAMINSIDRLLEFKPDIMYLTHYGALDEPRARAVNLKQWVNEYVSLCEEINPLEDPQVPVLERKMSQLICTKLQSGSSLSEKTILDLLAMDIRLNAQGLAIWWKQLQNA